MEKTKSLILRLLPETLCICRLSAETVLPSWALSGGFFSITRTAEELSLVVAETVVPGNAEGILMERGWRALMVVGPLDFALTGILASLTVPLADAGIPIFAISTFDTDYLLIKEIHLADTQRVLSDAGHSLL